MKPYLRDGIDVYIEDAPDGKLCTVIFVFLTTRKRIQIQAEKQLVATLPLLDGDKTLDDISCMTNTPIKNLETFVSYLELKNIVSARDWFTSLQLDEYYKQLTEKQLYFLMDTLQSVDDVCRVQTRMRNAKVAIVGVGSIGSWLLVELLQMGFENFFLYDFKTICDDSVARHAYYSETHVGENKADYYRDVAEKINPRSIVVSEIISINTDDTLLERLESQDLIINCADEPYIGYSSIFLSRFCVKHGKALYVAGGFDAHLGCLGEMIIPHKSPCSDCYNAYFRESLKDWKPVQHPVKDRTKGFGGLSPLSVFSASTAALSILRYFLDIEAFTETVGGRGEFKFDDYLIDSFEVRRDSKCGVCGDK